MTETHHDARINNAQRIAHEARGQALKNMLHAVPRIFSALRPGS
jgi:hypothetical protein